MMDLCLEFQDKWRREKMTLSLLGAADEERLTTMRKNGSCMSATCKRRMTYVAPSGGSIAMMAGVLQ